MDKPEIDDEVMAKIAEHGHAIFEIVDKNPGYSAAVYAGKVNPDTDDVGVYTAANGDFGVILECLYVDVIDAIQHRNDTRMLASIVSLLEAIRGTVGNDVLASVVSDVLSDTVDQESPQSFKAKFLH